MLPQPWLDTLSLILLSSTKHKDACSHLALVHACICRRGLHTHLPLGSRLVCLLARFGLVGNARAVFEGLSFPSELAWNSLIHGFLDHGHPSLAFSLYRRMRDMSVCPHAHTFTSLLQACSQSRELQIGREIHAHILENGLLKVDLFLGSSLVDMYIKCGSLEQAQELFDDLPLHNVVTWNVLICGYVQNYRAKEALHYFEQMQLHGPTPDAVTFTCILKACAILRALEKGEEIHAEINGKELLIRNPFIGSALLDMYAKCGALIRVQEVFDMLPVRNVVTWTTLISCYVQHEHGDEALIYCERMLSNGVDPNAVTYACSLKAAGMVGEINRGITFHAQVVRQHLLETDPTVGNALVDMYAQCGAVTRAREVFDTLPLTNVVTWNTLLTGYVQQEHAREAMDLFQDMRCRNVPPDAITYTTVLRACGSIGAIDEGSELHAEILNKGLSVLDPSIGNALVDMYSRCGSFAKAQEVFDLLHVQNIVTWNSLLCGYVHCEHTEEALKCFEQMQLQNVNPDATTWASVLRACGSVRVMKKALAVHVELTRNGLLEIDPFVGSALVDMYMKSGFVAKAQEAFNILAVRDVVTWTALIAGYVQNEQGEEALKCFEEMQHEGIPANAVTLSCSLKACGNIGALDKGSRIHKEIDGILCLKSDLFIGSSLVDMYAKCGSIVKALDVFDTLPARNRITWNGLITGYAQVGDLKSILHLLDRMTTEGTCPDSTSFLSILNACSHAGLVDEGHACFLCMKGAYNITPSLNHHTCLVDLLGRAGQLENAWAFIMKASYNCDAAMWLALLGSCRKWGDVDLGRQAFGQALQLAEKEASVYVCMFNIHGDADMQED